ncbi:MAG: nicotinate-nucleotide--dimethylbenzimidazole phosphoribosyltransferase, partial [Acidimicrobiales bacterium]
MADPVDDWMDDLLAGDLPAPDHAAREAVAARAAQVLRPAGALRRLDEVAVWLAGWQRTARPRVERPRAVVFVADHGVAGQGVSAYPASVTVEMLRALREGAATAAVLARGAGATLAVVDVGTGRPTADLAVAAALSRERFGQCWEAGRVAVADDATGADLLVLGEMGIANTTAAAAVAAVLHGGPTGDWVGRGTGLDDEGLARKTAVVDRARERLAGLAPTGVLHPLEVLRQVGGCELVAMASAAFEARRRSVPVLLDGYVVSAALAVLAAARPGALDHCLAGHVSPEPGHRRLLDHLGLI